MASGHNSNIIFGGVTYHVQTEDRGAQHPFVDTTIYLNGRVLHRRTNSYYDLLPLTPEREELLQRRVNAQHLAIVEETRSGTFQLSAPAAAAPACNELCLEVLNPKNWLSRGHAHLEVQVRRKPTQASVSGARVEAHVEGAATAAVFMAQTGPDGRATLNFPMPRITGGEAAIELFAAHGPEHAKLRFQLRAKPRT